jgi:hypothetical protein
VFPPAAIIRHQHPRGFGPGPSCPMTWPAWQKGFLPPDTKLEDFPSPLWLPLVEPLLPLGRPLTVISPCMGLDTAGHALRGLGAQWVTVAGCDTDEALLAPLQWLYALPGAPSEQLGGGAMTARLSSQRSPRFSSTRGCGEQLLL